MYKITEKIKNYLIDSSRDIKIPGVVKDPLKPYVAQNEEAIGVITKYLIAGSHCKFIVEDNLTDLDNLPDMSKFAGYYLYRKEELLPPGEPIVVERKLIDLYFQNEGDIDLTDCAIELPHDLDKLRAISITSLDELFKLIPEIKKCLDPKREKLFRLECQL